MLKLILGMALMALIATAQTQLDLRSQAKKVDFTEAVSTKPLKTGAALPEHCSVGEMFFKSNAPSGSNIYACAAIDTWEAQGGLSSQNCWYDSADTTLKCRDANGKTWAAVQTSTQGTANQWVDYITPAGAPHTSQPTAAAVGAVADPGANGIPYRSAAGVAAPANADQLSRPFSCQDAGAANTYACSLTPAITAYTSGSSYWFKANSANTGAATLNLNQLGAKPILKQATQQLGGGDILPGQWVLVTYDGIAMQMQSQTANPASGAIAAVFGRTGAVTAQAGDYTTAQVPESGNLYFTNSRAQQAFSYPGAVKLSSGTLDCPTCITSATAADTDLSGSFPHLSVAKLQGRAVASTQPADLQYLGWNSSASRWEPKTMTAAAITSIFGRAGAVTPQTGDYNFTQISGAASTTQLPVAAMRTDRSNSISAGTTQDFSAADHTLPMKSGAAASRPSTCQPGEAYFATDAAAGNNLYGCTTTNHWTVQGAAVTVRSDGVTVGSQATTNYVTGPGLISLITDTGAEIEVVSALDTAVVQTQPGEQSGSVLYCASSSNSASEFACDLAPSAVEYTPGMVLHWQPDVTGAGGPSTLNVDGLGAKAVKLPDGATDPAATDIIAGQLYEVWYDGERFRFMQTAAETGGVADPGANGVVYRSAGDSSAPATAHEMSSPFHCEDTGAGGNYACSLSPAIAAYTTRTVYWFKANSANSGAATINFNSLGAKTIKKQSSQSLAANDIVAGQIVMLTYDGTNMQMISPTANGGGAVASIFGRAGAVATAAGDYTTAQVTESGNLYYTDARARAAVAWDTLSGKPLSFAPTSHGASHRSGGSDEIATASPAASGIPKADANGKLAPGWFPTPGVATLGGILAGDCSGIGFVQRVNTDGSVSCATNSQGGGANGRTWTYLWQGAVQAGATGFTVNLPGSDAPVLSNSGGIRPVATLAWAGAKSTAYAWWTFVLPAGYVANSPITYTLETRSVDSAGYANAYVGLGCGGPSSALDNPTIVEAPAVQITAAAASGRTVTAGSITPNSGGLPACSSGDRVWINLRVDTNVLGHVMTQPFELISTAFSVQGGA